MTGTGLRRAAAALSFAAFLAACSSGSGGSASGTSTPAAGTSAAAASTPAAGTSTSAALITIQSFQFSTPASVSPGATVTVRNEDSTAHTVTADDGHAFDDQAPAGTSTFTAPSKPGSYPFHCTIHPFMKGTLVVK